MAAVLGQTKLEAVNTMLAAIGLGAVSALSPGDGSEEARAELFLDQWTTRVQAQGYSGNMIKGLKFAAASNIDVNTVTASNVLRLECIAPGRYAGNIEIVNGELYDITAATVSSAFTISADVYCNVWVERTWDQCSPVLKETILVQATQDYSARVKQRGDLPAILEKQAQMADRLADRNAPAIAELVPNTSPSNIRAQSPGGQGRPGG